MCFLFLGDCPYRIPENNVNCTEKLYDSFECYQAGIREFNLFKDGKQKSGCTFIKFLVNCCDQILCKAPDRHDSIQNYGIYIKEVLDNEFDLNKCNILEDSSNKLYGPIN